MKSLDSQIPRFPGFRPTGKIRTQNTKFCLERECLKPKNVETLKFQFVPLKINQVSLFLAFSVDHAWQISGVEGTKAAF